TYVDGTEETLRYARVEGSAVTTEIVDRGLARAGVANGDGRHLVGDDSSLVVLGDGERRVAYQDATTQEILLATRGVTDPEWSIRVVDDGKHTGFFLEQHPETGGSRVITWWKAPVATGLSGIRVIALP